MSNRSKQAAMADGFPASVGEALDANFRDYPDPKVQQCDRFIVVCRITDTRHACMKKRGHTDEHEDMHGMQWANTAAVEERIALAFMRGWHTGTSGADKPDNREWLTERSSAYMQGYDSGRTRYLLAQDLAQRTAREIVCPR